MSESEKLKDRIMNERNPVERAHLKNELDQIPLTSSELEQVQQREIDRKAAFVRSYREKRNQ